VTPAEILAAPRIEHDFMYWYRTAEAQPRRLLLRPGGISEMVERQIIPRTGLEVVFWSRDADDTGEPDALLAVGRLTWVPEYGLWAAEVVDDAFTHESELRRLSGEAGAGSLP
jgi:hypothetical protein